MAFVTIDTRAFLASWAAMRDAMDAAGKKAFDRAVMDAWHQQQGFGYNNQTGRLSRSMAWKTVRRGAFEYTGEVTAKAPYAEYVDKGTRPHVIKARGDGLLRFYWPKAGKWMAVKSVNHPGTKAAGFSAAAVQAFGQTAPALMEHAIGQAANKQ